MKHSLIPLDRTGLFPRLILDYLAAREDMAPFYEHPPTIEGLKARLAEVKAQKKDSGLLAEVLREQMGPDVTEAQKENIDALHADVAYTVCTGHQLCLFGGPAYFIYKIISTITLATRLSKETGEKIVPLFWLASEDHDVAEVDHCYLYGKKIQLTNDHIGPVGTMKLAAIEDALTQLSDLLGENERATEVMTRLRTEYNQGMNMTQATRNLVQDLFASSGLLILDAADSRLKKLFVPAMKKEVASQLVESSMAPTLEMLANRGENAQATGREINLFYMTSTSRDRIVKHEGGYQVLDSDIKWDLNSLAQEIEDHPERFSPNVLMRPIYQEIILPNLAYIGGPGELAYWLQLKEVFKAFGTSMPVAVLRDSFLWTDEKMLGRLSDLGLEVTDLFRDIHVLHRDHVAANSPEVPDLSLEKRSLISQFDQMIERSAAIDPGVAQYARSERQKLENAVDNLEKKLIRSEKKKHSDALDKITQLKEKVLPEGGLEERKENYLRWYISVGDKFFDILYEVSDPLSPGLKVIRT